MRENEKVLTANYKAWLRFKENKLAYSSLYVIGFYVLIAIIAPILPIYKYDTQVVEHANLKPSFQKAGELWLNKEREYLNKLAKVKKRDLTEAEREKLLKIEERIKSETKIINGKEVLIHERVYLLGTDNLGRDLLSRIIQGSQISISVGFIGAFISMIVGISVGALLGYVGGRVDAIGKKIIEILFTLPFMLVVIIMMTLMERNLIGLFIALSLISWLIIALVVRGQIISLKNSEFVQVALTLGASNKRIILKHLIPNTLGVIVIFTTLRVPAYILAEAFLSFLGLGISAPMTSWGDLIQSGMITFVEYPYKVFVPAIVMSVFLLFMNFLGDGLRDAFDPKDDL